MESKKLWKTAFPTMLTKITQFGMLVVTQAFIGRTGKLELAAYSIVQIIVVRLGQGTLGCQSATETMRASISSKAMPHDGYLLAAIMDRQFLYSNSPASCVYLLVTNLQATRTERR
ncbi:hypothetical protein GH714_004509 [Hevea brasiliensis]|uniref:Uncharacterized protein n=1 Tax=Hevea brasiliensis TaxID=3981 RepID=A0A6A6KJP1_HEVBR|nr:hypothetical protein GH714_004509 [Hevea brasiliensis]